MPAADRVTGLAALDATVCDEDLPDGMTRVVVTADTGGTAAPGAGVGSAAVVEFAVVGVGVIADGVAAVRPTAGAGLAGVSRWVRACQDCLSAAPRVGGWA